MGALEQVQITIKKIIGTEAGLGVMVAARVQAGMVHVGDPLQSHNGQPGPTARVGGIVVGSQAVKEANAGEEVTLWLENLSEADIHPGDRLLPGDESKLVPANADSALKMPARYFFRKAIDASNVPIDKREPTKLPARIEPILHARQLLGHSVWLAVLGVSWIFLVDLAFSFDRWIILTSVTGIILVVIGAVLSLFTFRRIGKLIQGLRGRRRFLAGQAQAEARVVDRRVVEHESQYGSTYTYYATLEFEPTLASVYAGPLRMEATISRNLYNGLGSSVQVTYAVDDPRIFILEGE